MPDAAADVIRREALWFEPTMSGLRSLVDAIGDARLVLIGEATHGTHEFYRTRAELTKALIAERGLNLVAVEADWPDAYRVNRWVRGASTDSSPEASLDDVTRFPRWMWRNRDVVEFAGWLREHNGTRPVSEQVGFYGLDLYSLNRSIEAVLAYLRKVDPDAAERALHRYGCFEMFGDDPQAYGYASSLGLSRDCESEVTSHSSWNCAARRSTMPAVTVALPPTTISLPSRMPVSWPVRKRTAGRCSVDEPTPGMCGTSTWWRRSRSIFRKPIRLASEGTSWHA